MKSPAASDDSPTRTTSIPTLMMAPCGMDCGVCAAHLREKNRCAGCLAVNGRKQGHCEVCSIKLCTERTAGATFCFDCARYPCRRLRQLDLRYRTRYGMSMIENLDRIREMGLRRVHGRREHTVGLPVVRRSHLRPRPALLRLRHPVRTSRKQGRLTAGGSNRSVAPGDGLTGAGNFAGTRAVLAVNVQCSRPNEGRHTLSFCTTGGIP